MAKLEISTKPCIMFIGESPSVYTAFTSRIDKDMNVAVEIVATPESTDDLFYNAEKFSAFYKLDVSNIAMLMMGVKRILKDLKSYAKAYNVKLKDMCYNMYLVSDLSDPIYRKALLFLTTVLNIALPFSVKTVLFDVDNEKIYEVNPTTLIFDISKVGNVKRKIIEYISSYLMDIDEISEGANMIRPIAFLVRIESIMRKTGLAPAEGDVDEEHVVVGGKKFRMIDKDRFTLIESEPDDVVLLKLQQLLNENKDIDMSEYVMIELDEPEMINKLKESKKKLQDLDKLIDEILGK